jgi:predicted aldo/keto reductase-like oxidoreductase
MRYKPLGNTGLLVSQLCLGTMTFSSGQGVYKHIGNVGQVEADDLVRASIEAGINFLRLARVKRRSANRSGIWKSRDMKLLSQRRVIHGRARGATRSARRAAI